MIRLLVITSLLILPSPASAKGAKSDVIVLILIDALRDDHVGIYGYKKPTTPNLDALAKEGTRYTRMYVNAPWTRPSIASFLTGAFASRHRTETQNSLLPERVRTLAQELKKEGYATAGFTANGNGGSLAGLEKGFDVFEDPSKTYSRGSRGKTYCCNGLPTGEFLVKRIKMWLDANKSPKKFIFVFFVDPHDPYGAPPELEKMFLGADFVGEPKRHATWEYNNDYTAEQRRQLVALYDAGIRYADHSLGELIDDFKRRGLYDRSTIMVTGDHGEGFGEHGFYLHAHHFWEEVIKVPLVVRGPGFTANAVQDRLIASIDVAKTIAEIAGTDGTGLPGNSLLRPAPARSHVISEYNEFGIHRQAIIGERYKVIWQRPADETWYLKVARDKKYFPSVSFDQEVIQVYDLVGDPGEKKDLSKDMPAAAKDLLKKLRAFVSESERLSPSKYVPKKKRRKGKMN